MSVVSLRGVSKEYVKYDDATSWLRTRTQRSTLRAIQDLDLEVEAGASVGVLGRNGAGKSTLLQMLSGVTAPSTGTVRVSGRVAPLISVGVGFHPELTGRENVYVNGTILGMSRREIDRRFDGVVAFSEIEQFIDTPVKFYSSGMFVRLGFSVAVAADPEVLLVDEVLAVGDYAFQMKCFRRMAEIRENGTTLVVVSHNMNAIRGLCERSIVLRKGCKLFDGETHDAVSAYYDSVGQLEQDVETGADEQVTLTSLELLGPDGAPTSHLRAGDSGTLRLTVDAGRRVERPCLGVTVVAENGTPVYTDTNRSSPFPALPAGGRVVYDVAFSAHLAGGAFTVSVTLHELTDDGQAPRLAGSQGLAFYVSGRPLVIGIADLGGSFTQTAL